MWRKLEFLTLGLFMLIHFGCGNTRAHHELSLGTLNTAASGSLLDAKFACPGTKRKTGKQIIVTLFFREVELKDIETPFSSTPDWPLLLGFMLSDASGHKVLAQGQLGITQMEITNGKAPKTSVILKMPAQFYQSLEPGKTYHAIFTVKHPADKIGKGELLLNWSE